MSFPPITKTVTINAPSPKVWQALTQPEVMKQWMSETEIEIITDWEAGSPFIIRGPWYKTQFINSGTVLAFEPERNLRYSHLSSLSRLPDVPENYTILDFALKPVAEKTELMLTASNFPTEAIYRHFAFYWSVALEILKKTVEKQ